MPSDVGAAGGEQPCGCGFLDGVGRSSLSVATSGIIPYQAGEVGEAGARDGEFTVVG